MHNPNSHWTAVHQLARPRAQTTNPDVAYHDHAVHAPLIGSPLQQKSALKDVALLDFFSRDLRPTFIIDIDHPKHIAYENEALKNHLRIHRTDRSSFDVWALTTPFNISPVTVRFARRAWSSVPLQQRWVVVSACCQDLVSTHLGPSHPPVPLSPVRALSGESSMSPLSRLVLPNRSVSGGDSDASSDTRRGSTAPSVTSSWRTLSEDGGDSDVRALRRLDWLRQPVYGMSAHIQLVQRFPWHNTPVGSIESWPDTLRQVVLAMMNNVEPRVVMWGEERRMIYNEACSLIFGQKHPAAMGAKAEEIWSESWSDLSHIVQRAEREGKSTRISRMPLTMNRHGFHEETHWSLQVSLWDGFDE